MNAPHSVHLLLGCFGILLLAQCTEDTAPLPGLTFAYDGFGPEQLAAPLLGPKGQDTHVVARFGSTQSSAPATGPDVRYVNIEQTMNFLRRTVRGLPHTEDGAALHQRLAATYGRMCRQYCARRNSVTAAPSASYGRGGMNRAFIMPPMPPAI